MQISNLCGPSTSEIKQRNKEHSGPTPVLYIFTLEVFSVKKSEMAGPSGPMNFVLLDFI